MKKVMFLFLMMGFLIAQDQTYFLTQNSSNNLTVLARWDGNELDTLYDFKRSELVFPQSKLAYDDYYHSIYGFGVNAANETRFFKYDLVKEEMNILPKEITGFQKQYNYDLKYFGGHLILITDSTGFDQGGSVWNFNLTTLEIQNVDLYDFSVKGFEGYVSEVNNNGDVFFFAKEGGMTNDGALMTYNALNHQLDLLCFFSSISQFNTNVVLRGPSGAPVQSGDSLYFATTQGGMNNLGGIVVHNLVTNEAEMLQDFDFTNRIVQKGRPQFFQDTLTFLSDAYGAGNLPFIVQFDLNNQTLGSKALFDSTEVATPVGGMDFYENKFVGLADYSMSGSMGAVYSYLGDSVIWESNLTTSAFDIKGAPLLIDLRARPELSFNEDTSVTCDGSFVVVPFTVNNPSGQTQHHFEVYSDNEEVIPPFNAIVSGTFPNYNLNITPLLNTNGIVHLTIVYDNGYDHEFHYHTVFVGSYIEVQDSLVYPQAGNDGAIFLDVQGEYTQISWSNGVQDTTAIGQLNPGIYGVTIIDENQCTFTASYELLQSSFENLELIQANIFPNPGQNYLKIESNSLEDLNVNIYSLQGQLLYQDVFNNALEIDTKEWTTGVYIINLELEGQVKNYKWIKH